MQALRNAHAWAGEIRAGAALKDLANAKKICPRHMSRTMHLAGLSPKIQTAILKGKQPVDLTLQKLRNVPIPLDWQEQERVFGFS